MNQKGLHFFFLLISWFIFHLLFFSPDPSLLPISHFSFLFLYLCLCMLIYMYVSFLSTSTLSLLSPPPFLFLCFPLLFLSFHLVCVRSAWSPAEGHRLQSDPAGELPNLPQPPGPVRRPQRHVRPHPTAAADHWGPVLRQRGLLQAIPSGQQHLSLLLSIVQKRFPFISNGR